MSARYAVRPYEPGDERAFLSLFERALDGRMSEAWFDWKYRSNPYVDHVPILLAEADGEVVGARSFFPLELRADGAEYVAFQPCDTMVHPDHRRRGLFTRMTEAAIDRYADDADCFFNFPNELSLPGNLELGWRIVGARATYYRVQNPVAWLPDGVPEAAGRFAARSYLSARDRFAPSPPEVAHRWYDRAPPELLASLAASGAPRRFHVARDEAFYRWRFANPQWTYETVVARDGGPTAAVVVASKTRRDGSTVVRLADVVPLVGGADRERALSALLPAILREHADADVITAPGTGLPGSLLSAHGFHSDRRAPLSWVASPTVQVARPIDERGDWTLGDRALAEPRNWHLALCERDGV